MDPIGLFVLLPAVAALSAYFAVRQWRKDGHRPTEVASLEVSETQYRREVLVIHSEDDESLPPRFSTEEAEAVVQRHLKLNMQRLRVAQLERAAVVMWATDPETLRITYSTGGAHARYGTNGEDVVGTSMEDWPSPHVFRAVVRALQAGEAETISVDCPDWLVPSRVTYALDECGAVIGIAVPAPNDDDARIISKYSEG